MSNLLSFSHHQTQPINQINTLYQFTHHIHPLALCTPPLYQQLMALQLWITCVLALGMIETTTLFAHYLAWNDYGRPTIAVTFVALFFGVMKRSMSRVTQHNTTLHCFTATLLHLFIQLILLHFCIVLCRNIPCRGSRGIPFDVSSYLSPCRISFFLHNSCHPTLLIHLPPKTPSLHFLSLSI